MKMKTITYSDIDVVLLPWAKAHHLTVYTECKDEPVRTVLFVDSRGDQYSIYAIPDWNNHNETVRVGADLEKRGNKKHTFYRERIKYHFQKSVALSELVSTLEEAWAAVVAWGESSREAQT